MKLSTPRPELPDIDQLNQPYCDEGGETVWLLVNAYPTPAQALKEARLLGIDGDVDIQQVGVRFVHTDDLEGYGPSWGIEEAEDASEARAWRVHMA